MTAVYDLEQLQDRAHDLTDYNGIERVFVSLEPAATPSFALLDVEFFNGRQLTIIKNELDGGAAASDIFRLSGGTRIIAGTEAGQVSVVSASKTGNNRYRLQIEPVGDYSSYTLSINHNGFDPLFQSIDFKFRPGCFNTRCAPYDNYDEPAIEPVIDYLAKDFDSFKHVLINAMQERVPAWQPTSEADLDQVLIDLIAADADELSDYQDRVMNEAYFGRARKRLSLARYARLLDYHIHQGNQASTWIAVEVSADHTVPKGFGVWTGAEWQDNNAVIFTSTDDQQCFVDLNVLQLYTWGDVVTALEAGSTTADLVSPNGTDKVHAEALLNLLRRDDITVLAIEEKLNPETGSVNGRNKTRRQLLHLLAGNAAAELIEDPVNSAWAVRIHWRESDRLQQRYCFVAHCSGSTPVHGVSAFHGNLIYVTHGRPHVTTFRAAGTELNPSDNNQFIRTDEAYYEETNWGTVCHLPHAFLAYRNTPPGGDQRTYAALSVEVDGFADEWEEQSDLIESESDATHYIVETDEYDRSCIRFGNNTNGRDLPEGARVVCRYQIGRGSAGNIGADSLTSFDGSPTGYPNVDAVWNPFDVTDGRDPEDAAEIIRRVPEAYRARQLRAVTLEDYADRAEELPEVAHAKARYAWTGSWRTVRVAIDPKGTDELSEENREKIAAYLDAVRLIGEDLEVRGARYAALDILLRVCAQPDFWPEDLAYELEQEFSDGYTADGRMGFFHPDNWTFGQPLHASQLIGRAMSVTGVERVLEVSMRRWYGGNGPSTSTITLDPEDLSGNIVDTLDVDPFEIILVANDPNQLEKGRIQFDIVGGRR